MKPDDEMIVGVVDTTRDMLKSSKSCIMPSFFIGNDAEIIVVGSLFDNDKDKDAAAAVVKMKVAEMDAKFVLFVAESYVMKDQAAGEEYMANRSKYKTLADHPKSIEVVMFKLETKNRCWHALADILPGREMGELKWEETKEISGRFSNFFSGNKPTIQ